MDYNILFEMLTVENAKKRKRRVFISYYHYDDGSYRKKFEKKFSDLFQNISVKPGEIDDANSDRYIYQLIRQGKISNATVVVVLIGNRTYCRKHIDWEISAALDRRVGNKKAGVVGILLPTSKLFNTNIIEWIKKIKEEEVDIKERNIYSVTDDINKELATQKFHELPPRFLDNLLSGYAVFYKWTEKLPKIINIIEEAFTNRKYEDLVVNARKQYSINRCGG